MSGRGFDIIAFGIDHGTHTQHPQRSLENVLDGCVRMAHGIFVGSHTQGLDGALHVVSGGSQTRLHAEPGVVLGDLWHGFSVGLDSVALDLACQVGGFIEFGLRESVNLEVWCNAAGLQMHFSLV